jgi:hypothetical protein
MEGISRARKGPGFLVKLFSFIIILFLLDYGVGSILKYYYFKQKLGLLYRTTYAMDSTCADILVYGSSTANHHYVSDLISKRLHMTCYNTGRDGISLLYSYAVFQSDIKRHIPKMVILDLYDQAFMKDQENYDRLSSLLPYYAKHPEIRSIFHLKSPYERYKLVSKIYPYNSMLFTIGIGNSDMNKGRPETEDQNGYVPAVNTINSKVALTIDTSYSKYEIDKNLVDAFLSFINDCNKLNITLYVFQSPKFKIFEHEDSTIKMAEKIAGNFKVPFYSFANDSFFLNHLELYSDNAHLNDMGARIFTDRILGKIMEKK